MVGDLPDPMLELSRARLALKADLGDHGPWMGPNHAQCPYCFARDQVHSHRLAMARPKTARGADRLAVAF